MTSTFLGHAEYCQNSWGLWLQDFPYFGVAGLESDLGIVLEVEVEGIQGSGPLATYFIQSSCACCGA